MGNKKKILFLMGSMNNGGTESFVINYYRRINKELYQCDFLVIKGSEDYYQEEIQSLGGGYCHLYHKNTDRYIWQTGKVLKYLRSKQYDVIHIQSCSLRLMAFGGILSKITGCKKIIGHSHSVGEPRSSIIDKICRPLLIKFCSAILDYGFACSMGSGEGKYTKDFLASSKFSLIPNAIETEKFKFDAENRASIREKYGVEENVMLMGIVGRLEREKNQGFLIDILYGLPTKLNAKLIIIGDGYTKNDLVEKIKGLGLSDKVIFTGQVSDVYKYYSAMDIFCLPSFGEGFPFVLVEAQANGLKCFVSDDTSEETNISGDVEYLTIDDIEPWVEKINENGRKRISLQSVQKVIDEYDIDKNVGKLQYYYSL